MKCLKNLLYILCIKKPTYYLVSFFTLSNFTFPHKNALVYVDIDQGIHKRKSKVAKHENRNKQKILHEFSYIHT